MHIRNIEILGYIYITQLTLVKKTNPSNPCPCVWINVGAARKFIETYQVPELDRLVDEGKILNWGYMQHYMADEYDIIYWYELNGIDDYWDITAEVGRNIAQKATKEERQAHADNTINHKDGIYAIRHRKAMN